MTRHIDWENALYHRKIAPHLPAWLVQSWGRCAARLNPIGHYRTTNLSNEVLELLLRQHSVLLKLARPIMEDILQMLEPLPTIMLLCDSTGCVLDLVATPAMTHVLDQMGITHGMFLGEAHTGTNAVGVALIEASSVQVVGAEHFSIHWHPYVTSAAPMFTLEGHMIGVLGLIQPEHVNSPATLGLVVSTAKAIENQYSIELLNQKINAYQNELNTVISATSEPVIAWRSDGIVTYINAHAAQIIGQPRERVVGHPMEQVLVLPSTLREYVDAHQEVSDEEVVLAFQQAEYNCLANLRVIHDEAHQTIYILTLRPIEQLQQLVNRFIGARVRLGIGNLIGESDVMKRLRRHVEAAARGSAAVLITGETGTGKSLIAQAIHALSNYASGPFISLNCRAIPREMALEELMGFEASRSIEKGQPSKFELAHGGTLFLSEVEALPLNAQAAVLRVIETGNLIRLGGVRQIPVNVRLIASTTTSLDELVAAGSFRADLFFQLSAIHVTAPPLRKRLSDIPALIADILQRLTTELKRSLQLSDEALKILCEYDYPGNLHELQAIIERAASKTDDDLINADVIIDSMHDHRRLSDPAGAPISQSLRQMEQAAILNALAHAKGNMTQAAQILGIGRTTLWRKLRLYRLLDQVPSR
ncbi:MAG: sigma 54-interacting transcriptional regulator [Aggregatilineales bacterium]